MALRNPVVLGSDGMPVEIPKTDVWRMGWNLFQKGTASYEMWCAVGCSSASSGTSTFSLSGLMTGLMMIPFTMTFDRTAINVATADSGATGLIGIYALTHQQDDISPAARLFQSGSLDLASTGVKTATIDWTLTPGLYWACFYKSSATVSISTKANTLNIGNSSSLGSYFCLTKSGATMDDPAPSSWTLSNLAPPLIGFRRSA